MQKRRRSIQRSIDLQVLQEAENDARLEESVMAEEIVDRENQVFENRRQNVRLEMGISASRKKMQLHKLGLKVGSVLDRLAFAKESLEKSSARKIKDIEDEYTREKAAYEKELQRIENEEENKKDCHRLMRRHRQSFHARDLNKAEEDLVARIQSNEDEDWVY